MESRHRARCWLTFAMSRRRRSGATKGTKARSGLAVGLHGFVRQFVLPTLLLNIGEPALKVRGSSSRIREIVVRGTVFVFVFKQQVVGLS